MVARNVVVVARTFVRLRSVHRHRVCLNTRIVRLLGNILQYVTTRNAIICWGTVTFLFNSRFVWSSIGVLQWCGSRHIIGLCIVHRYYQRVLSKTIGNVLPRCFTLSSWSFFCGSIDGGHALNWQCLLSSLFVFRFCFIVPFSLFIRSMCVQDRVQPCGKGYNVSGK